MIRLLLREALLTAVLLALASLGAFLVLDATGRYDWWGTAESAMRAGVSRDRALCRDLPVAWNSRVVDAQVRTLDDLAALGDPATRTAAQARLIHRGTAALPTLLEHLPTLPAAQRRGALEALAAMAPTITGGEVPPADPVAAGQYWARFDALRGLDFRYAYATRQVQRLVSHESANAEEQLARLGTYAFPAVFAALDEPLDADSAERLTGLLADLTGKSLRVPAGATAEQTRVVVFAWRGWWFTEHLEYETLTDIGRALGHVTEARYGRWLERILTGRSSTSLVTGQSVLWEARRRLPASAFIAGLGGLLATALVVAFGGGSVLQRRPLRTKLLDLVGALVPGLTAFILGFVALLQICAAPEPANALSREVFTHWFRLSLAVILLTPPAVAWLRRRSERVALHAVRQEAESWALESRHPHFGQVMRHGFRVGLASLLAPLGLSGMPLVGLTLLVEPLTGVRGMGALSLQSLARADAPWILLATLSIVPIWLGRRWARRVLIWALGDPSVRSAPPMSIMPPAMSIAPAAIAPDMTADGAATATTTVEDDAGNVLSESDLARPAAIPRAPRVPQFDALDGLETEGDAGAGPETSGR